MNGQEELVLLEKDENIAILTLNRPEQLNAINAPMRDQLYEYILAIRDDPTVDAVVIRGMGRGFCSGADLSEFGTETHVIQKRRIRLQVDLWEEMRKLSKPIATAMHGFAIGSGLELAMLCDFRFAAPATKLALPESQIGMIPAAGGTQSLPRLALQGAAINFALGGRRISAEEGYKMNIISRIIEEEDVSKAAVDFMKRITAPSPLTARWIKSLVAHGMDTTIQQGLAREMILAARSRAT